MDDLKIGTTYDVEHSRKGNFTLKVTHVGDEWIRGKIVSGRATLISEADYVSGEMISVRRSLASFTISDEETA